MCLHMIPLQASAADILVDFGSISQNRELISVRILISYCLFRLTLVPPSYQRAACITPHPWPSVAACQSSHACRDGSLQEVEVHSQDTAGRPAHRHMAGDPWICAQGCTVCHPPHYAAVQCFAAFTTWHELLQRSSCLQNHSSICTSVSIGKRLAGNLLQSPNPLSLDVAVHPQLLLLAAIKVIC